MRPSHPSRADSSFGTMKPTRRGTGPFGAGAAGGDGVGRRRGSGEGVAVCGWPDSFRARIILKFLIHLVSWGHRPGNFA